jgi:hypothetical protein
MVDILRKVIQYTYVINATYIRFSLKELCTEIFKAKDSEIVN